MKKFCNKCVFVCMLNLLFVGNIYAQTKIPYSQKIISGALAVGYSKIKNCDVGSSTSGQIMFSLSLYSVYFDFAVSPVGTGESVYGSGGISDRHRVCNFGLGYLYPIYKNRFYITPIIGFCDNSILLNDQYYKSDVYDSVYSMDYGGVACFRFSDSFGMFCKVTNHQIGITVGLVM